MKTNAAINIPSSAPSSVHVAELNWGEPLPEIIPVKQAGLILAADCMYFEVGRPSFC